MWWLAIHPHTCVLFKIYQRQEGERLFSHIAEAFHLATATVGEWIVAGLRVEIARNIGSAHLLENMAFKAQSCPRTLVNLKHFVVFA